MEGRTEIATGVKPQEKIEATCRESCVLAAPVVQADRRRRESAAISSPVLPSAVNSSARRNLRAMSLRRVSLPPLYASASPLLCPLVTGSQASNMTQDGSQTCCNWHNQPPRAPSQAPDTFGCRT